MRTTRGCGLGLLCVLASAGVSAETLNPDELPRDAIPNPAGGYIYNVRYLNRSWREKKPEALLARQIPEEEDICFEAKFDSVSGRAVKLFMQEGKIVCLDTRLVESMKKLNRSENVWICGSLRPVKEGLGVELLLEQIIKLPEDLERQKSKIEMLEKRRNAQGKVDAGALLEAGKEIEALLEDKIHNFNQHDEFLTLQKRAYTSALAILEAQLDPQDADGLYALADKWEELMHKKQKKFDLVLRVLKIDPGHPRAGKVASEEMDMVRYEGAWMTREDREKILAELKAQKDKREAEQRAKLEAQTRQREEVVRERMTRLLRHQRALRAAEDLKALETALKTLGMEIQKSPDPQFCRKGIDLLASLADPAAIYPGLDLAAQNEAPEVRGEAYEALAWRGNETALKTLAFGLRQEKDASAAKAGVGALVQRADRPALAALIDCLRSENDAVVAEVVEGLKSLQRSTLSTKGAWLRWWEANQGRQDIQPKP